jgi:hypothetical protein
MASDWRIWVLAVICVLAGAAIAVVVTGDRDNSATRGSGIQVSDRRELVPFTAVELAGANTVLIHVGVPPSVTVTGDDNLVGRVTTEVRAGRLIVDNTGSFTTTAPMSVEVSVPSLDRVELAGAGTIVIDGVSTGDFRAEIGGDGTLTASGTVERLTAVLAGAGTLDLHDLVAGASTVRLPGTGTVRVHAISTLDATLSGTGTIRYRGNPSLTTHNSGVGTVGPE